MWPDDRPALYDPDLVYDTSADAWVAQSVQLPKSGEKLCWLICVSEDGEIYFGEV